MENQVNEIRKLMKAYQNFIFAIIQIMSLFHWQKQLQLSAVQIRDNSTLKKLGKQY